MRNAIVALTLWIVLTSAAHAVEDYTGSFTTQALYTMCSTNNPISRSKCNLYLQGLLYGLNIQKFVQDKHMPVCLPAMTPEQARVHILQFIDGMTGGKPSTNGDSGDWIAFMGVAAGHICK